MREIYGAKQVRPVQLFSERHSRTVKKNSLTFGTLSQKVPRPAEAGSPETFAEP